MIRLELLEETDFSNIVRWNAGKNKNYIFQWAGSAFEYPLTEKQIKDKFHQKRINMSNSNTFFYKIVLYGTNEMIGIVELANIDKVHNHAYINKFYIKEGHRGNGYGKFALKEIINVATKEFGVRVIALGVYDVSERAIRCYESIGFKKDEFTGYTYDAGDRMWKLYDMELRVDDIKLE